MAHNHSEEKKRKISEANMGRYISPEQRRKQSETRKRLYAEGKLKIPLYELIDVALSDG